MRKLVGLGTAYLWLDVDILFHGRSLNLHVQTAADGIEPTTDDLYDEAEVAHEDAPESMFSQVDATTVVQHDDVEDAQMDEDTIAEPTQMPCPLSNVTTKLGQMDIDENGGMPGNDKFLRSFD